jgi:UDP-N-acetylglucosamine 2-epimerase (non-hydrolysing)
LSFHFGRGNVLLPKLGGRLRFADIRLVIGTRPEAIKLAPVANGLAQCGLDPRLLLTGQHPDLDLAEFGLGRFATVRLDCPGEEDPHRHVGRVTAAVSAVLAGPPDLLVVQGDTSSALGGALAAFTAGVPVAHVEAGLRTHDLQLPWPEEECRTAIDARADLLFAPTELAAANLRDERVPGEIHVTGNSGIDTVLATEGELPVATLRDGGRLRILVTCHRRESWGEGLASIAAAIAELSHDRRAQIDVVLHPNRHVAAQIRSLLAGIPNVSLIDPCSHYGLLRRIRDADLVLSDSGGIQEEAPTLGTPLLVLREKSERPEGIADGSARLVGTATERIVEEARWLLDSPLERLRMSRRSFPYGDGKSGPRIAAIIEDWLEKRSGPSQESAPERRADYSHQR